METIENRIYKRQELFYTVWVAGPLDRDELWQKLSYSKAEAEVLLKELIGHNKIFWEAHKGFMTTTVRPREFICKNCRGKYLWHENDKFLFCPICDDY